PLKLKVRRGGCGGDEAGAVGLWSGFRRARLLLAVLLDAFEILHRIRELEVAHLNASFEGAITHVVHENHRNVCDVQRLRTFPSTNRPYPGKSRLLEAGPKIRSTGRRIGGT